MNADLIRAQMRMRRRALSYEEAQALSQALCARVRTMAAYRHARTILLYWATDGEISPLSLLKDTEKCFYLPRVEARGNMSARLYTGKDCLETGKYGIAAPCAQSRRIMPTHIDLVLVPGIAFSDTLERIGQGGGYYDRFLEKTRAVRVGILYDFQLLKCVPQHPLDARMHILITPTQTIGGNRHGQ